jgi:dUTP pyrophosphatase
VSGQRGDDAAEQLPVLIRRLDPDVPLPAYAQPGDAGADLVSTVDLVLGPGERALVGTGIALALPEGYAAFVHPRSGLATRAGLGMVNTPGTIDSGYRGEIKVTLLNTDRHAPIRLRRGDRIAQLIIQRVERARFEAVEVLPASERGDNGFGSTGGSAALVGPAAARARAGDGITQHSEGTTGGIR